MLRRVGRYMISAEFAVGGMASVHLGRLVGPVGFSRTVAIKQLHPMFAKDPDVCAMLVDEARLAGRIRHVNVVSMVDVVTDSDQMFLVMEYVHGQSLSQLLFGGRAPKETGDSSQSRCPIPVASALVSDLLRGLHAAHETRNEQGELLGIVHRDVSPQNVVVGCDGIARVLDFGIAKAVSRAQTTDGNRLKGKIGYMAPEQLLQQPVDPRTDVFAATVVLWETLTGERLFAADDLIGLRLANLDAPARSPRAFRSDVPEGLDRLVSRGLRRDPNARFQTAAEMADALERAVPPSGRADVGAWVESVAGEVIRVRGRLISAMENDAAEPLARATSSEVVTVTVAEAVKPLGAAAAGEEKRSAAKMLFVGVLAATALTTGVTVLGWRRGHAERDASRVPPAPPYVAVASSVAAAPRPPDSGTPVPGRRAIAIPSSSAPVQVKRPGVQSSTKKPKDDCDPPFEYDKDGVKQFKAKCI